MLKFLRETLTEAGAPTDIVRSTVFGYVVYEVHIGHSRLRIATLDVIEQRFHVSEDWLNDSLDVEYGEPVEVQGVEGLRHVIQQFAERADQA